MFVSCTHYLYLISSVVGVLGVIIVMLTVVVKFATSAYTPGVIGHSPRGLSEIMSAVPAIFFAYQVCPKIFFQLTCLTLPEMAG